MKRYVLDTSIIPGYLRGAPYAAYVEKTFSPLTPPNIPFQSIAIDAFRQNKHPKHKRDGQNAFAMSDNDIWIAATASVLQATLLTTDKDFIPLNQVFLDVSLIDAAI